MKRKLVWILSIACTLCLSLLLAACGGTSSQYFIAMEDTKGLTMKGNVISVEYGDSLTVPEGEVTDASGATYDLTVTHKMTDNTGKDITKAIPMYDLEHGKDYTLTYHADTTGVEGVEIADLVYKIVCRDTTVPEVELTGVKSSYNLGEKFSVYLSNVSDASGVKGDTASVKVFKKGGAEVALTVSGSEYSFDTTENGQYELKVVAEDVVGNKYEEVKEFSVYQPYLEPNEKNVLWGFEDLNAFSNVQTLSGSDEFTFEVTETRADPANANSSKSLKLSLAEDSRVKFDLVMGNETPVVEMGEVYLRVYSTGLIDEFRVANTFDYEAVSFDYEVLKKTWTTVSFVALDEYKEGTSIDSLRFEIWVEEAAEIYIDGIYYTDYVAPWQDEDLKENQLATFDKPEYANRLGDLVGMQGDQYAGVVEYLSADDPSVPVGANGGVIKFTSNSELSTKIFPSGTSDGFYYDCGGKIYVEDIDTLVFRAHFGNYKWLSFHIALVTDFGTTYGWFTPSTGGVDEYEYFLAPMAKLVSADATYFTGMYIRVMKAAQYPETANLPQSIYFDEISLIKKNSGANALASGNYNFDDFSEFSNVTGSVSLTQDEGRTVLKANYVYNKENPGVATVKFGDIDLNNYDGVYVLMKFAFSAGASLLVNDVSVEYARYTEYGYVNIKQLVLEYNAKIAGDSEKTPVSMVLSSFGVRDGNPGTLYIDKIVAVPKGGNAGFEFAGESDLARITHTKSAVVNFVEDTKATDGKALRVATPHLTDTNTGVIINLGGLEVANYESIKLRIRAESNKTVLFMMNGSTVGNAALTEEYVEVDLLALANGKSLTTLDSVAVVRPSTAMVFYIDSVILVEKA